MPSLIAILGADISKLQAGFKQATGDAHKAGGNIGSALGEGITGALKTWVGVEGVKKVFEEMKKQGEEAHAAILGGFKLGVGPEEFVQLEKAASKFGASIGDVSTAFKKIAQGSVEAQGGNSDLIASFQTLGVSMGDIKNKKVDEIFRIIAHNLKDADFNASQVTALIKTMGRGANELIPAFKEGAFSKDSPFADSEAAIEKADKFHKDMAVISGSMKRVWRDMFSPEANQNITGGIGFIADKVRGFFGLSKEASKSKPVDLKTVTAAEIEAEKVKEKESAKLAKERVDLEEKLGELRRHNAFDALSKEEQINETHRRRLELARFVAENWAKLTQENKLKAQIDLEGMVGDEERLKRGIGEKPKAHEVRNLNELQRIGAFSNPPSLDIAKASDQKLSRIEGHLSTLVKSQRGVNGVQF